MTRTHTNKKKKKKKTQKIIKDKPMQIKFQMYSKQEAKLNKITHNDACT